MFKSLGSKLGTLAAMTVVAGSASAAIVNGSFVVTNAIITDLYSTTLDGVPSGTLNNAACVAPVDAQACTFFTGEVTPNIPANRAISITNNGYGAGLQYGVFNVDYEDTTGEITTVNTMTIHLQDLTIGIKAIPAFGFSVPTVVSVVNGNGIGLPGGPFGAPGPVPNDQTTIFSTADGDTGVAIGQASIFQTPLGDAGPTNNPDFPAFLAIVDSCAPLAGGACGLLGLLTLDADKYRLDGTVNANGTIGNMLLRAQTANNSIYEVQFAAELVPVPAAVWLFGSALGLMGFARRRLAA